MPTELRFRKAGAEIKAAASAKMVQIQSRLKRRHEALDEFLRDQTFVRSCLIRSSKAPYGMHGGRSLWSEADISSERMEEIRQLCERIYDLESEMHRLKLVVAHLADNQAFDLRYEDLAGYGFEVQGVGPNPALRLTGTAGEQALDVGAGGARGVGAGGAGARSDARATPL